DLKQGPSSLINRQVAMFDRQRQDRQRRAVVATPRSVVPVTGKPAPVPVLVLQQDRDELLVIRTKLRVAQLKERLRHVIHLVEKILARPLRRVLAQIGRAPKRLRREPRPGKLQREDPNTRPWVVRRTPRLIREATALDLAAP